MRLASYPSPSNNSLLKMKDLRVMTGPFDLSPLDVKRGWRLSGEWAKCQWYSSMRLTIFREWPGLLLGLGGYSAGKVGA